MTCTLGDSVRLAMILRHVGVNEIHNVWADGDREDGG